MWVWVWVWVWLWVWVWVWVVWCMPVGVHCGLVEGAVRATGVLCPHCGYELLVEHSMQSTVCLAPPPPAGAEDGSGRDLTAPPYAVMEHAPLAVFVNGVLTALNELRHCALQGAARPAAR